MRLDERARRCSERDGWRQRLLFDEAVACQLTEGDLVHLEDLVLLDGCVRVGPATVPLAQAHYVLRTWRHALQCDAVDLLRAERPGTPMLLIEATHEDVPRPRRKLETLPPEVEVVMLDGERRDAWRHALDMTVDLPPLLAAAVAWDAWLSLLPEAGGAWRAPLLAALVLKTRGATADYLLPIDTGRRFAAYRRHSDQSWQQRVAGFLTWLETAVHKADNELDRRVLAGKQLRQKISRRRAHSRLPALIWLFQSCPLVTVSMAARVLGCSHQAIEQMLPLLGSTVQEVTGRKRFRAWSVP